MCDRTKFQKNRPDGFRDIAIFQFLPRDAMLSAVYAVIVCLCVYVCLSVCVSVTLRYCIKMAKCSIMQTMRTIAPEL